jgi:hypothetical protein
MRFSSFPPLGGVRQTCVMAGRGFYVKFSNFNKPLPAPPMGGNRTGLRFSFKA